MLGLLAASLALAAQPAAAPPTMDDIRRAIFELAGCNKIEAERLAITGTDAPDAIVTASFAACRERDQRVAQLVTAQVGAAEAAPVMTSMHNQARQQMLRAIAEARGTPRVRGEGDESLVWGECTRREARSRAGGSGTIEALVTATRQACATEEQVARAALTRRDGAAEAERVMAPLTAGLVERMREIIAETRGDAR